MLHWINTMVQNIFSTNLKSVINIDISMKRDCISSIETLAIFTFLIKFYHWLNEKASTSIADVMMILSRLCTALNVQKVKEWWFQTHICKSNSQHSCIQTYLNNFSRERERGRERLKCWIRITFYLFRTTSKLVSREKQKSLNNRQSS